MVNQQAAAAIARSTNPARPAFGACVRNSELSRVCEYIGQKEPTSDSESAFASASHPTRRPAGRPRHPDCRQNRPPLAAWAAQQVRPALKNCRLSLGIACVGPAPLVELSELGICGRLQPKLLKSQRRD